MTNFLYGMCQKYFSSIFIDDNNNDLQYNFF